MDCLLEDAGTDAGEAAKAAAPLKVLIADDHPLILMGLRRTLEGSDDIEVVGEAHSGSEVMGLVERRRPSLVLLDLRMPGIDGDQFIAQLVGNYPNVKVVVLSACEDWASVNSALTAGASAYIVKSVKPIDVVSVLRQAGSGAIFSAPMAVGVRRQAPDSAEPAESSLTDRETTILLAIARGLTTKSISSDMWISEHTVKFHLTNIYRKLGVSNRSSAVRYALENGLA
jgi:DNA-binding NarL/FixJ family response regulator